MLTAKSEEVSKIKASELYSAYYVTKPIGPDELAAKIESTLKIGKKKE